MPSRKELANAIRALSMDAVQKAKSGHPGMPMGMADIAQVLWSDYLVHNPSNPNWINRDRFIISNGHGSMLLYSLLHLTGYDLPIEELKNFRQWHSKTPGHPEHGLTPGVETTTGPLGQGLANAVGMSIAQHMLASTFNRKDFPIIDHYIYCFLGDGCLMEGISHEACSLAGTLGLGKLICFWDDNGISIDGEVKGWFTDDTAKRFAAYHWHVIPNVDGHDPEQIKQAIEQARKVTDKPTLICCKTIIGYGAPNAQGHHKSHGAPLGDAEIAAAKEQLAWQYEPFVIPDTIYQAWDAKAKGQAAEKDWQALFQQYQTNFPELAASLTKRLENQLPDNWEILSNQFIAECQEKMATVASRKASQLCLEAFAPYVPQLVGGSADLTESNLTHWAGSKAISHHDFTGNYINFGVREFGMSAIANGLALYKGFIPYVGTFLTFCDYARNAVRMAALMQLQAIFVYTHDSIGLGEDGPTHQPIEHLSMLRATPGIEVWRPCDTVETAVAWQQAVEQKQAPSCLILSRQNLRAEHRDKIQIENIKRGGYILFESAQAPEVILLATGSEVQIAVEAAVALQEKGKHIRVVSMPCTTRFDRQDQDYKHAVLPANIPHRIAIEAGQPDFWYKYVGLSGKILGISRFGESAPAPTIFQQFGFTVENIIHEIETMLGDKS